MSLATILQDFKSSTSIQIVAAALAGIVAVSPVSAADDSYPNNCGRSQYDANICAVTEAVNYSVKGVSLMYVRSKDSVGLSEKNLQELDNLMADLSRNGINPLIYEIYSPKAAKDHIFVIVNGNQYPASNNRQYGLNELHSVGALAKREFRRYEAFLKQNGISVANVKTPYPVAPF